MQGARNVPSAAFEVFVGYPSRHGGDDCSKMLNSFLKIWLNLILVVDQPWYKRCQSSSFG